MATVTDIIGQLCNNHNNNDAHRSCSFNSIQVITRTKYVEISEFLSVKTDVR